MALLGRAADSVTCLQPVRLRGHEQVVGQRPLRGGPQATASVPPTRLLTETVKAAHASLNSRIDGSRLSCREQQDGVARQPVFNHVVTAADGGQRGVGMTANRIPQHPSTLVTGWQSLSQSLIGVGAVQVEA